MRCMFTWFLSENWRFMPVRVRESVIHVVAVASFDCELAWCWSFIFIVFNRL